MNIIRDGVALVDEEEREAVQEAEEDEEEEGRGKKNPFSRFCFTRIVYYLVAFVY